MGVQWRDSLNLGIASIDDQHKELFSRTNELLNACNTGKGNEEVGKLIDFLEDYVVTHFRDEERLQLKLNYPKHKEHKVLHDNFIKEVKGLKERFFNGGSTLTLTIEINKKVIDWLINHIGKMDREFGNYIEEQKATV